MRFTYLVAATAAISIPAFSAPITRFLQRRALFADAVKFSNLGDAQGLAAAVGNLIGGPEEVCASVSYLFAALSDGETAGGTTTVGDRAVAGVRKMLGLEKMSADAGVDSLIKKILAGPSEFPPKSLRALQDLVANPDKTIASLKSYKYLLDTQTSLQALIDATKKVDGSPQIVTTVSSTVLPVMKSMETIIDKIGGAFSTQSFNPADVDELLKVLSDSSAKVTSLRGMNISFASAVTAAVTVVEGAFTNLADSVKAAAAIPESARKIPVEAFQKHDNLCKATDPVVKKLDI